MNSQQERRVIEALQALTGGLTVTDHDILEAGGRLQQALAEPPPHRRRLVALAVAAVVLLAATVTGVLLTRGDQDAAPAKHPAPHTDAILGLDDPFLDGPPPTRHELVGLWQYRSDDSGAFTLIWLLKPNGTYTFDPEGVDRTGEFVNKHHSATIDGGDEQGAWNVGDGTLQLSAAGNGCTYTWAAALMSQDSVMHDGSLHIKLASAQGGTECPNFGAGDAFTLKRVFPDRDPSLDALVPPPAREFGPATNDFDIIGVWFRSGDPGMLLFNPDHGFAYAADGDWDSGPDVLGTWELADGRLVLTTDESCAAGARLVVSAPRVGSGDTGEPGHNDTVAWLRGTPSGSDCGAGYGSSWTWQRL